MHGIRLIQFQHGDVGVQFAGKIHLGEQRGDHATHEVRAGGIGEYLQSQIRKHRSDHAGGGGLAVRARNQYHAERQLIQCARQESGVDFLHDLAWQRRTTMFGDAGSEANQSAYSHGGKHDHTP